VPAGAVSLKNMMLPAGFVAQTRAPFSVQSFHVAARQGPSHPSSIQISGATGWSAPKHNVFERFAPHEAIEIGGDHAPAPFGCRFA